MLPREASAAATSAGRRVSAPGAAAAAAAAEEEDEEEAEMETETEMEPNETTRSPRSIPASSAGEEAATLSTRAKGSRRAR